MINYLFDTKPFLKVKIIQNLNQTFHYTRRITPKRVTSLRCPSPHHSAKAAQPICVGVEAVANRLQYCVRFGRPGIRTPAHEARA